MFNRKKVCQTIVSQALPKEPSGIHSSKENGKAVSSSLEEKKPIRYDAIVVGEGLGGISAAIKVAETGKNVLVIEARSEEKLRPQLIFLSDKGRLAIQELYHDRWHDEYINDKEFFLKVRTTKFGHYGIKDIQRFLKRRINTQSCSFLYNTTVSAINMEEGYVSISDGSSTSQQKKIYFKNLVLSDGAKHLTANLLYPHIQYQPTEGRPEIRHVMAYLTVTAKGDRQMRIPSWNTAMLVDGNYCGLVYYDNHSFEKNQYKKMKICVVMHVPDDLWEQFENRDMGIAYLRHCAASVFDEQRHTITMTASRIEKGGLEKDKLKYSRFSLEYFQATQAAFEFYNKYRVYLVGDTRKSPDFYQGHGGNDAIIDGLLAGLCINKQLSFLEYIQLCEARADEVSRTTRQFQPVNVYFKRMLRNFIVPPFMYRDETVVIHSLKDDPEMKEEKSIELSPLVASRSPIPHSPIAESKAGNGAGITLFAPRAKVKPPTQSEASPCCVLL